MGKKSTKKNELGRALARKHQQRTQNRNAFNTQNAEIAAAVGRHTERSDGHTQLASVLEANDLDELMTNAALANKTFAAERYAQPISASSQSVIVVTPTSYQATSNERRKRNEQELRIPRRPQWSIDMTFQQLMQNEEDSFLTWRRNIATLENEISGLGSLLSLTPFEKNLDVWRQLWRVVERSDIILQIVDARNPLLFACTDLVRFVVEEKQKKHLLVMNKADLLSSEMVQEWANYFAEKNIDVIFFSAFAESVAQPTHDELIVNANQLIQRLENLDVVKPANSDNQKADSDKIMVGLCGYPNVGKSSTINVLLETVANFNQGQGEQTPRKESDSDESSSRSSSSDDDEGDDDDRTRDGQEEIEDDDDNTEQSNTAPSVKTALGTTGKRVGVSSTPGKTKHFQTLPLTEQVTLCDCPGLVFPNFAASKAELICAGVLSIDTMRGDYETPVSLIVSRIPYSILAAVYGLTFTSVPSSSQYVSAETFLATHARARGFMTDHGRPDSSRSARVVLKDFVSGRLVYVHHPKDYEKGEAAVGAAVFAKKGKLVHQRLEEHSTKVKNSANRTNVPLKDTVGFEQLEDLNLGGSEGGGSSARQQVKAFISGGKKNRPVGPTGKRRGKLEKEEFVRVQRTYDGSSSSIM